MPDMEKNVFISKMSFIRFVLSNEDISFFIILFSYR